MSQLTPREIVSELDRYIIGQGKAKRMVAVAMRNRWRRQQLEPDLRDEIAPKNIIMMGPTGVGKTEIARRLAKLANSPFLKVEATKFTEVGYVGRDVESMIRDLMEISVNLVRQEETDRVRIKAEKNAEDRILDLFLPQSKPSTPSGGMFMGFGGQQEQPAQPVETSPTMDATREKFRKMWREGTLDDKEVEVQVTSQAPQMEIMTIPGMEDMGNQMQDALSRFMPENKKNRKMRARDAYEVLIEEEAAKLVDMDAVTELAKERVEQTGIVFIDEIDKIAVRSDAGSGGSTDVSREGVQRDLLPVVEGSVVSTKYGMVKTDHILFIAAGAFHYAKPSDLIPELQGRFPLREELHALGKDEFYRIITEPKNALTVQYKALLETEGITIDFTKEALLGIAEMAERINEETENIGARRLYTIMEKILAEISFEAPDRSGDTIVIDRDYVGEQIGDIVEDRDLSRYIL
ncbi:MAG: ATP-dependent protease ATPase subunit HslU [Desulfovibrio sp.]